MIKFNKKKKKTVGNYYIEVGNILLIIFENAFFFLFSRVKNSLSIWKYM